MSGINRYESFVAAAYGGPYAAMRPSDSGNWVGFTEHEAEVARLRAELQNAAKAALDAVALSCEKEREADALRAEVDGLRKDAERYRWLIQSLFSQWFAVGEAEIGMRVYGQCPSKEVVESAIDAAMGASA